LTKPTFITTIAARYFNNSNKNIEKEFNMTEIFLINLSQKTIDEVIKKLVELRLEEEEKERKRLKAFQRLEEKLKTDEVITEEEWKILYKGYTYRQNEIRVFIDVPVFDKNNLLKENLYIVTRLYIETHNRFLLSGITEEGKNFTAHVKSSLISDEVISRKRTFRNLSFRNHPL
jgi:predicted ester cyclase